jgi:hypothetical protein
MPTGTVGCNVDADCCPTAEGTVMCGGSGSYGASEASSQVGYGVCCRGKSSVCGQDSDCCDGYCQLNRPPAPNDAGYCYPTLECTY